MAGRLGRQGAMKLPWLIACVRWLVVIATEVGRIWVTTGWWGGARRGRGDCPQTSSAVVMAVVMATTMVVLVVIAKK